LTYRELTPHPALRPYVDRLWTQAGPAAMRPRRILPDGCIDIMVDLVRGGSAQAIGTMTRTAIFASAEPVRAVAVRFRPGGAVPFLRAPAHEITDRVVDGPDLGLRWLDTARLVTFAGLEGAARYLERLLLGRLAAAPRPHPIVDHAVRALFRADPPTIAALERTLGWSRQHLARTFRHHIGVSPKLLGRVARMQRAVAELQGRPGATLADLAMRAGYFDQAHMALDFRVLVGVSPSEVRAAVGSILPIRSLVDES
jgi:AraC-like DNA-binding protein